MMITESTSVIAPPPERHDVNPSMLSESDFLPHPSLDPLFLSTSDPITMDAPISDFDFLQDNGSFADFDFLYDSDDFFDFTLDAEPAVVVPEEIGNRPNLDSPETRNGDRCSEGRSDSVHSEVSSQGSKTFVSGASDTVDGLSSPDPTSNPQKSSVSKRKKEKKDSGGENRSCKYQKFGNHKSTATNNDDDDDDKKRVMRQIRNRESAQLSRLRKKQHIEDLEGKVKSMNATIAELNGKISYVMAENATLRQQMVAASGAPPMNPYMATPPLPYQWMPYPSYAFRGYGSQTPVVPIPKLNPKPVSGCRPKKTESKKNEGKSKLKKVASISLIGVLFFFFLFGTLVQFMNVNYGGDNGSFSGVSKYEGQRYYDEHKAKVLMVGDGSDGSDLGIESGNLEENTHPSRRIHGDRDSCGGVDYNAHPKVGHPNLLSNASEPLFASLYVPRNDRLVKIDGNLIIQSVLASEKAMAFKKNISEKVKSNKPDSRVPSTLSSALAVPEVRGNAAMLPHSTALSSEGKQLHQWFHEGGSGTLMDYSMCTEVFQFDVAPGAIVPSSVSNISAEHLQNVTTHGKRMKNRRILERLPASLVQPNKDAQNKSFHGDTNNKPTSSSSMVVSVLLDARDIVDSETDRVVPPKPKSLSRILVVVLLDSVKYVTYSCSLPRSGLHLVAT